MKSSSGPANSIVVKVFDTILQVGRGGRAGGGGGLSKSVVL